MAGTDEHPEDGGPTVGGGAPGEERRASPELLAKLVHGAPVAMIVVDAVGTITFCSDAVTPLFGYQPDDLVGTNMLDHVDVDWNPIALESIVSAMAAEGLRLPMLFRIVHADGQRSVVEVTAHAAMDDPVVQGLAVYIRPWNEQAGIDDILEALAGDETLTTKLGLFVRVMAGETLRSDGAVLYAPADGRFGRVVAAPDLDPVLHGALTGGVLATGGPDDTPWLRALATGEDQLVRAADLPAPLAEAAARTGHHACWAFPVRGSSGEVEATLVLWRRHPGDIEESYLVWIRRLARLTLLVLEQEEARSRLTHAATHDALTGLANRAAFFAHLEALLAGGTSGVAADGTRSDHLASAVGVLYLDLDGFKPVNDRLGHGAGDAVLVALARRFLARVRPGDLVARLGGDEFAVACGGLSGPDDLDALADRLAAAAAEPISVGDDEVVVGASIGAALTPAISGRTPAPDSAEVARAIDQLIEVADGALYAAKATRVRRPAILVPVS